MNELKRLRDELMGWTEYGQWLTLSPKLKEIAERLDAYIKAQESAEPVAKVVNTFSAGHTTRWIGEGKRPPLGALLYAAPPPHEPVCPYLQPRSGTHVCILSGASPPPREPISREALAQRMPIRPEFHEICEALRALGIEITP